MTTTPVILLSKEFEFDGVFYTFPKESKEILKSAQFSDGTGFAISAMQK
jgi:hypothetical protein